MSYGAGKFNQGLNLSAGGYLNVPSSAASPGTLLKTNGTFTVDFWVYRTGTPGASTAVGFDEMSPSTTVNYWSFGLSSSNKATLYWWPGAGHWLAGTTTIPANAWTHLALSVKNGVAQIYVNGVLDASGTISTPGGSMPVTFGGASGNAFPGMIDDLRVTPGVARFTANFTPPPSTFANN